MRGLVEDAAVRESVFGMIEREYHLTAQMLLRVSGGRQIAERFPQLRTGWRASCRPSRRPTGSRSSCCAAIAPRGTRPSGRRTRHRCCSRSTASPRGSAAPDERGSYTRGIDHELYHHRAGHAAPAPLRAGGSGLQPGVVREGRAIRRRHHLPRLRGCGGAGRQGAGAQEHQSRGSTSSTGAPRP